MCAVCSDRHCTVYVHTTQCEMLMCESIATKSESMLAHRTLALPVIPHFVAFQFKTTHRKYMIDATHQGCKVNRHYACAAVVFQPEMAGKLDELTHS